MSISPPSDIVLDVLRASDPMRQHAAAQKLMRSAGAGSPGSQPIITPAAAVPVRTSFEAEMTATLSSHRANLSDAGRASANAPAGAVHRQFEAMVLRDFVQRMLPANAEATFGQGTAGDVWKSWMADAVSKEVANAGGIGISKLLKPAATMPPPEPAFPPGVINPVMPDAAPDIVTVQAYDVPGPSGFFAKLHEIFLKVFSSDRSVEAGEAGRLNSRPAFDV